MPVSMMMPMVGSSPNVSGRSSVMPATGPSPGSTPTTAPHKQPRKQYSTPFQERATANPPIRCSKPAISPGANRQLDPQQQMKEPPAGCQAEYRRGDCAQERNSANQHEDRGRKQCERDVGAETLENERYSEQGCDSHEDIAMPQLDGLVFAGAAAIDADESSAKNYKSAQEQWNDPRPRRCNPANIERERLPSKECASSRQQTSDEHSTDTIAEYAR